MGQPEDIVSIDIGPDTYEGWSAYEVDSDLLNAADAWSVTGWLSGTYQERRDALARIREAGGRVYVYVQRMREDGSPGPRALQMSGIVDHLSSHGDRHGAILTMKGRDNGGLLASSSADPRLGVTEETTLVEMVEALVEPFGISVITEGAPGRTIMTGARSSRGRDQLIADHARSYGVPSGQMRQSLIRRRALAREGRRAPIDETAGTASSRSVGRARRGHAGGLTGSDIERLRLPEAKPRIGECIWEFIDRHCRRFGVMPWIDAEGRLVISSPDYDQEPLFQLRRHLDASAHPGGNNILEGGFAQDWQALSSECTVYGRAFGSDAARSPFHATETNPNQPLYRPLVIHDATVRSEEEAARRARRELNRQNAAAFVLEYEVAGHGQGSLIWAQDTTVDVIDEEIAVEGIYYVTSRKFVGNGKDGPRTHLRLVPLGAIVL